VQINNKTFKPYLDAATLQKRIAEMGKEITADFHDKQPIFIIVLTGAFAFSSELIRNFQGKCVVRFTRIKSYTGTQSGDIETFTGFDIDIKNRHVIFLEDIIDTGKTVFHLTKEAEKLQPASITVATLLQKQILRPNLIKGDYVGFEIPDVFVVGFGLDYNEEGRNWNGVYQLESNSQL
jgi:hypoxanthine phosphoribosyltransferase